MPRAAALAYVPALAVSGILGYKTIHAILGHAGHPAVPLDDAFIHFQYARNLASGHFFTYAPGDSFTAGATSLLWPMALAVAHLFGFHDLSIIWVAWILGFLAHAALIVETYRLSSQLTGRAVAVGAAAMSAVFGGFIWFAASGMETIPLAWILVRTARVASDWCEATPQARTARLRNELAVLGFAAPLVRPEGALASVMAAIALARFAQSNARTRTRLIALVPVAGVAIIPLINLIMTGSSSSNTATVKWLPLNPYYASLGALWVPVRDNISLMFSTLLNGEQWSAIFVPKAATPWAIAALVAIPVLGWRSSKGWRAAFALLLALGMFIPCTYMSFLWNRLRYLWPFATGWFVAFACLARLVAELAANVQRRWIAIGPVLSGVVAGMLAHFISWSIDDVAQSASAIDRQQVALGRWAHDNLASNAIVGVNDTGAIAYLSELHTFDVVGLTTQGESRYWVAGSGSRFEHYERMVAEQPLRFPTYFIVYPQWMSCPPVLGPEIHEAAVYDQTILGGPRMVVYPARRDLLGSGALPLTMQLDGAPLDELDIADLESEAAHQYNVLESGHEDRSNRVHTDSGMGEGSDREWADGGRFERVADTFSLQLAAGAAARGIARFVGPERTDASLTVSVDGRQVGTVQVQAGHACEVTFDIPAELAHPGARVHVQATSGYFGSLHYWFARGRAPGQ